jgi:hypothetical protein
VQEKSSLPCTCTPRPVVLVQTGTVHEQARLLLIGELAKLGNFFIFLCYVTAMAESVTKRNDLHSHRHCSLLRDHRPASPAATYSDDAHDSSC